MRVKTGTTRRKRHKKVLKSTKGYRMSKSKLYKPAHEAAMHAGQYAQAHRRKRGAQMRRIWIKRITAAVALYDMKYKDFIKGLKDSKIEINRKMLSEVAVNMPEAFEAIVKEIK
jgi:large subunit ribosomal protein L20